jgi:UDP-GlcNAc:undecaprenyl-phosphate GlcNAc-1-phosphate transferase
LLRYYSDWLLLGGYLFFSAAVIATFSIARRTGWQIKRFDLLDLLIIGNLRRLRAEGTIIKVTFRIFENGIPLLLFFTCLLPAHVPRYVSVACLLSLGAILLARLFGRAWPSTLLRVTLYLLIPVGVYFGDHGTVWWMDALAVRLYNCAFGVFAVFIVIISKFSRRKNGFRSTPLDFLILIMVIIGPNLPDQQIQEFQLGLIAAKIIILYFCFEVLMAELRGKFDRIALATMGSLLALGLR